VKAAAAGDKDRGGEEIVDMAGGLVKDSWDAKTAFCSLVSGPPEGKHELPKIF
jgi:hypothetical protein